jgi:hypothetical protein
MPFPWVANVMYKHSEGCGCGKLDSTYYLWAMADAVPSQTWYMHVLQLWV